MRLENTMSGPNLVETKHRDRGKIRTRNCRVTSRFRRQGSIHACWRL